MSLIQLNPRVKRFAQIFVRLWFEQYEGGQKNPRVGRTAALLAGYGAGSWTPENAVQTADVMANRLTKDPGVLAYMENLGLERDGKRWRPSEDYKNRLAEALARA